MTFADVLQFLHAHWATIGAFAGLAYISFVNALPEKRQDWDTYQVLYHFLRGLTPTSRLPQPTPPSVPKS